MPGAVARKSSVGGDGDGVGVGGGGVGAVAGQVRGDECLDVVARSGGGEHRAAVGGEADVVEVAADDLAGDDRSRGSRRSTS